ncbi:nucleotidyltransferase domain-containing protein [Salinibacter altiplanensis]|uniref:nucleotidyltransferase domain-containing protein n=1 Tax=Salinibacter altiplanensis TaxID=1803181 RepID=UPI000C9F6B24|nr:nucleotidyltransferase family protein [Salinibacter altiplanensis]
MATSLLSPSTKTAILEDPSSSSAQAVASTEMSDSDAYALVRTCLSHRCSAARRETAQSLLESGVDWGAAQRLARWHRVLPLFLHNVTELLGPELPSAMREQIRDHRRGVRIRNTFLAQELSRVCQRFDDAGLPLLVMKGPVLAQAAYGDIALRHSVDADVAIPSDQFSEADRLLKDLGYEHASKRTGMWEWQASLSRYLDGQWEFTRGDTFTLDVHTRLMPPGYSFPPDFQSFWERARPVQLGDTGSVPGFSPEDRLLVLVHHGIKNQWRALRHVADIAAVVQREDDLQWERLLARAERMDAARALKLGLYMAHDLLGGMLPDRVHDWASGPPVQNVAAPLQEYLANRPERQSLPYGARVQMQLATKDTLAGQVRYGAHSLLQHLWSAVLRS